MSSLPLTPVDRFNQIGAADTNPNPPGSQTPDRVSNFPVTGITDASGAITGLVRPDGGVQGVLRPAASPSGAVAWPTGEVLALSEVTPYVTRTTTGTAFSGACELAGYDCTAASGGATIAIFDNTSASGTVIVPTTALAVGRTEFAWKRALTIGCHVVITGTATVNVLVG